MRFLRRWADQGRRAKRLREAEMRIQNGDVRGALTLLEASLQETPDDVQTAVRIVELRAELGEIDAVVEGLTRLIERDSRHVELLSSAVFDALRDQEAFHRVYATAIDALRRRAEAEPDEPNLRFQLAECHEAIDDVDAAHALYTELSASEDEETQYRAYYMDGRLHAASGNAQQAAESLRRAIALDPDALAAIESDAAFDTVRGTDPFRELEVFALECRIEALRETIERERDNPLPCRTLIDLLLSHSRAEEAVAVATDALERFPGDLGLLELRANALFDADEADNAMEAYQDVLRVQPNHAWATYRTGVLYERQDNPNAARSAYRDALDAVREDAGVAFLIARGFARVGDRIGALDALAAARESALHFATVPPDRLADRIENEADFAALRDDAEFHAILAGLRADATEIAGE